MAIVKLPSGRTVRTPDGLTRQENIEHIFNNLEGREGYEEDRKRLGDQLETSGWGSTIGGTIGGLAGGIGGIFTSPSIVVNPVTLGAAGGAAGAAAGEGFEQWLTGKGDWSDIGEDALIGGALGGIGGGTAGAVARYGAKAGALGGGLAGGLEGGKDGGATGAAVGAVTGVVTGGFGGRLFSGVTGRLASRLGLDKPAKGALQGALDAADTYVRGSTSLSMGLQTGAFQQAKAKLDFKRHVLRVGLEAAKRLFREETGETMSAATEAGIRRELSDQADDLLRRKLEERAAQSAGRAVAEGAEDLGQEAVSALSRATQQAASDLGESPVVVQLVEKGRKLVSLDGFPETYDAATGALVGMRSRFEDGGLVREDRSQMALRRLHEEGRSPAQASALMKQFRERGFI